MRTLLLITVFVLASCKEETAPLPLSSSEKSEITKNPISAPKISYVLAVYEVEEPSFKYFEAVYDINYNLISPPSAYTEWKPELYCSSIQEIQDFTEDDGYRLLDEAQKIVITQSAEYIADVKTHQMTSEKRSEMLQNYTRIKNRYFLTFETYKEASEKKQIILYGK